MCFLPAACSLRSSSGLFLPPCSCSAVLQCALSSWTCELKETLPLYRFGRDANTAVEQQLKNTRLECGEPRNWGSRKDEDHWALSVISLCLLLTGTVWLAASRPHCDAFPTAKGVLVQEGAQINASLPSGKCLLVGCLVGPTREVTNRKCTLRRQKTGIFRYFQAFDTKIVSFPSAYSAVFPQLLHSFATQIFMLIFESITKKQHFGIDGVSESPKQWARWSEQRGSTSLSGVEVIVKEQRKGARGCKMVAKGSEDAVNIQFLLHLMVFH